jgi:ribonuclease VapC
LFVDTSALVAMLTSEDSADSLGARLTEAPLRITSPVVILEAAMVLSTRKDIEPIEAEFQIRLFLDDAAIAVGTIDEDTATAAVAAFEKFGKGRGNKARLNIADCLSYACAKQHRMPLLYVGDDFAQTDLG